MLPPKIILEEVPRLSTWPVQFLDNYATEDNIALYFFAVDLERFSFLEKFVFVHVNYQAYIAAAFFLADILLNILLMQI